MEKIKILIADDHTIFRQGLKMLLEQEDDMEVIGEAGNGMQTLDLVKKLKSYLVVLQTAGSQQIAPIFRVNPLADSVPQAV